MALDEVEMLDLMLVETSAADFHCAPHLVLSLGRLHKRFTQQQLRAAIWHHSSKLNKRVALYPRHENERKDEARDCFLAVARKLCSLQQEHIKACANAVAYGQYQLDNKTRQHDGI